MKKNFLSPFYLIALVAIMSMFWSCSKEKISTPPETSSLAPEDILQANELVQAQVVPGIYTVLKFIDTGDDQTAQFNGYTFKFRADGVLVARTNTGDVFMGTWKLNSAETRMAISISGTPALNDLDDDSWKVVIITDHRISLRKPGPDKVIFVM